MGPRILSPIKVNNQEHEAFIDPGSPVTIISFKCLLEVYEANNPQLEESECREIAVNSIDSPSITLLHYGGGEVPVLGETEVELSCRSGSVTAIVMVQEDAQHNILLGTDTLGDLGFYVTRHTQPPPEYTSSLNQNAKTTEGVVAKLTKSVKIPARHTKLLEVLMEDVSTCTPILTEGITSIQGLVIEPTLVQPVDGKAVMLIRNEGLSPFVLENGMELGKASPVEICDTLSESEKPVANVCTTNVQEPNESQDRLSLLWKQLSIANTPISLEERDRLTELVKEYSDIFALSEEELTTTNTVQHTIETEDNQPIKQPPRRVPYSMKHKVKELVDNMLSRGVIEPSNSPCSSLLY